MKRNSLLHFIIFAAVKHVFADEVRASYKTDFKCTHHDADQDYAVIDKKQLTLECDYSSLTGVDSLTWRQDREIMFEYEYSATKLHSRELFKDRIKGKEKVTDGVISIPLKSVHKTQDEKIYECRVQTNQGKERIDSFDLTNKIRDPPTKNQLTDMLTVFQKENPEDQLNNVTIIMIIVSINTSISNGYQFLNCLPVKITIELDSINIKNKSCYEECSFTIRKELPEKKKYTFKARAELFGTFSDPFSLELDNEGGPNTGLIIGLVAVSVFVASVVTGGIIYIICRRNSKKTSKKVPQAEETSLKPVDV